MKIEHVALYVKDLEKAKDFFDALIVLRQYIYAYYLYALEKNRAI